MFPRYQIQTHRAAAVAASGTATLAFFFPKDARIKRYWVVPSAANAASSSVTVGIVFTDVGDDDSGTTVLATFTNDTDVTDDTDKKSGAYAALVPVAIDTEDRPGSPTHNDNSMDAVAAGSVVKAVITAAASTTTSDFTVGIEYVEST